MTWDNNDNIVSTLGFIKLTFPTLATQARGFEHIPARCQEDSRWLIGYWPITEPWPTVIGQVSPAMAKIIYPGTYL